MRSYRWGQRHTLLALCLGAVIVGYLDRVNLTIAAFQMQERFHWSSATKGVVFSAFFGGYIVALIPAGWLAMRIGGKRVLMAAVLLWSTFTILTPLAAATSFTALMVCRVCVGLGEAAVWPSSYELFSHWIPRSERARSVSILLSGIPLSQVIAFPVSGAVVTQWGWPAAFYAFGIAGLAWSLAWNRLTLDDPEAHPRIQVLERQQLRENAVNRRTSGSSAVPWRVLLFAPAVWAIVIGAMASNLGLYFLLNWLPSYFRESHALSIWHASLFSAAPWIAAFVATNLAAVLSDRAIGAGRNPTVVRKIVLCGGLLGTAFFMVLVRSVQSPVTALWMICAAASALGMTWAGYAPNQLDVAPRSAPVLAGFVNTMSQIPGLIGVVIVGWLVDVTGSFDAAFVFAGAVCVAGAVFYGIYGSAQPLEMPDVTSVRDHF
jgi:ACS family sodium-dependent inorganic phosphate cotransporter